MDRPPPLTRAALSRIEAWLDEYRRHCKNPRCSSRLNYPDAATVGRRPDFCRPACRAAYKRDRDRHLAVAATVRAHIATGVPVAPAWARAEAHVRWALRHYGVDLARFYQATMADQGPPHLTLDTSKPPVARPLTLTCLHPNCSSRCEYRTGRQGRQRLFCGNKCRDAYPRDRDRMIRHWGELAWTYQFTKFADSVARIERAARKLEWLLEAYGIRDVRQHARLPVRPSEYDEALEARRQSGLPLFISRLGRELTAEEVEIDRRAHDAERAWYGGRDIRRRL